DQAWRLGLNCIQHTDALQLVQHRIYELQNKIGCGIQISKWSPKGPLVVQSIESNHPISIVTKVGSIMPLVNSAAGRVFAAYLPEPIISVPESMADQESRPTSITEWGPGKTPQGRAR
ncbi:IclR family transcriptional regulator domain-containing protein, partial [Vogesella mureinivorans]|uniref:IclR family transcriptional regulator domain-containing protein n=1 Tax=Vogesella mureinivorans TaxID=657276 RepID=UPI0019824612